MLNISNVYLHMHKYTKVILNTYMWIFFLLESKFSRETETYGKCINVN